MLAERDAIHRLDHCMPAAKEARLGQTLDDAVTNLNALKADFEALKTKYAALLAHLDTANVANIGAANAATYAAPASTSVTIAVLGARP